MRQRTWDYDQCKQALVMLLQGEPFGEVAAQLNVSTTDLAARLGHLRRDLEEAAEKNNRRIAPTAQDTYEWEHFKKMFVTQFFKGGNLLTERDFILRTIRKIEITSDTLGHPLSSNLFTPGHNPGLKPLAQTSFL